MKTIVGQFFDGLRPVAVPARLEFAGGAVTLAADHLSVCYDNADLRVSPRISGADRFIAFPDGMQFVCADQDFLETLPQESASEGLVAWLEARWKAAAACVVAIAVLLLAGYFAGLPVLARHLADRIPMKTERALGRQVLSWFDENRWLKLSELDFTRRDEIVAGFNRLKAGLPFEDDYRLEFRSGAMFGPNAFALPGGIIVLTDELVELADGTEEVLAVLAHEIGHVDMRHAVRSVLQDSIVAATAATITADAATLSVAVAGLPMILARTKYSRKFETAADDYAFRLLKRKGYSPAAFATVMEKMDARHGARPSAVGYLSTHPLTEERIQRAREAASGFVPKQPSD